MLCIQDGVQNNWVKSKYGGSFWIGYTDMPPYGGRQHTKRYGWVTLATVIGFLVNQTLVGLMIVA